VLSKQDLDFLLKKFPKFSGEVVYLICISNSELYIQFGAAEVKEEAKEEAKEGAEGGEGN
jgi:hypothetical protein